MPHGSFDLSHQRTKSEDHDREHTPVDGNVGLAVQVQLGRGSVECSQQACQETEFVQSHDECLQIAMEDGRG